MLMKWRSSIKPSLLRTTLLRGSILAGAGALLLLFVGAFVPLAQVKVWGIPTLIVAFVLITIGLLPYKRLSRLQTFPDELHFNGESLLFVRKGKALFLIPLSAILSIRYLEEDPLYGFCIKLDPSKEKVKLLDPKFDLKKLAIETQLRFPKYDLFLPYFSKRSFEELEEAIESGRL